MEFYDKFLDRFQGLLKVKNSDASKAKVEKLLRTFKRKYSWEYMMLSHWLCLT